MGLALPRAVAQELVWGAYFDFFFDNREYKSELNWPQSLFGARIAPELGVSWDGRHSIISAPSRSRPTTKSSVIISMIRPSSKLMPA